MLKLLKLYTTDYFKKLVVTFLLSVIAGIVLFYPLAENLTEQILFLNWTLYISMYGVFFYHFPLSNIVKWSVNLPLKKKDLIIFNILYQTIKIIATMACIIFAFWVEYQLFKDNLYVGQLNDNVQILKEYAFNRDLVAVKRGFLPAMKLMIFILSFSFFFTFIFNVAPYGPFKNKLITFRDSLNFIVFKFKTFNYKDLIFLLAIVGLIALTPSLYSKAFIAGIFVASMLCILYFTYEKALIFSKSTRFYCVSLSLFIGTYTWLGLINYSKKILERDDLSIMDKIEEWEFLNKPHFGTDPVRQMAFYLSSPDLCDKEIKKIFFYFRKKHRIAVNQVFQYPNAFEKIILSKSKCGLKAISKTIDPNMMTTQMFIQYFNKWRESSISYAPQSYRKIISPFLERQFNKTEIIELINSNNPIAQFYILQLIKKYPHLYSAEDLQKVTDKFVDGGLLALQDYVKSNLCSSYPLSDFQNGSVILKNKCARQRKISSVIDNPKPSE